MHSKPTAFPVSKRIISSIGNTHNENIRIFPGLYIGRGRKEVAGLSRVNLSPERE